MGCLGVLFALAEGERARLLACEGDEEVMALVEEVEEAWDGARVCELDKAWDALHRCLTDGRLEYGNGEFPLSRAVLGGRPLLGGEDYVVCYVDPGQVRAVAAALEPVDEAWLRRRYAELEFEDYEGVRGEEDLAYTVCFLPDLREFYRRAAEEGRAVVFTVDQ
ncbi:YfbM family protein [Kitasatospora sp. NPDC059673]|uniref:YfbM family protein n=1 Tax=Kitasatospora sp. NPDC059673 TaxID=3346901 RepID=UPI0036C0B57A